MPLHLRLSGQEGSPNGKALNIPFRKYGISIGNSHEFNGFRINLSDKEVRKINGLNLTFWVSRDYGKNEVVNGINTGFCPTASISQPVTIGLFGAGGNTVNGLCLGGIVTGVGGNINGISISGLLTMADGSTSKISGIALSGIAIGANSAINGIAIGGLIVGTDGDINGIATSLAYMRCKSLYQGIAVTCGYSDINRMHGISFALFNKVKELYGLQIGLINYAGNNPAILRWLPLLNAHFGSSKGG